jgi:hypothetical protein
MKDFGIEAPLSSRELHETAFSNRYIVADVIAEGQPLVLAGASKAMKTSIAIDLALSLAGPNKFLGRFWVPERKRVLFLSAESGAATIQETARRVYKSKDSETELSDETEIAWGFWVPKARNSVQLQILEHQVKEHAADVVILDPLYQILDGTDAASLSLNGEQLAAVCNRCTSLGATPILVDHVKRGSSNAKDRKPLELNDITGAGKAEFFRQWILVSRREEFDPEKPFHKLWMTVGGSAGHCGAYGVEIDESRDVDNLRTWDVLCEFASETRLRDATGAPRAARNKKSITAGRFSEFDDYESSSFTGGPCSEGSF